ncbi:single-stranded DNA-binding protein [Ectobacillus polymachus]|uniref:single-stranded DNA-binding protein n=1 Tax=Ectobacillus polymachus TaxID=1508806 RepID=UPI003A83A5D5
MINRVVLIGRLTRDPELLYSKQGLAYAKIRIAVNRNFKNGNGEQETDFIDCTVWRKSAETITQYCAKGSLIGITGRIQTSSYENKEGKRVYGTNVSAENVTFLERKKENAENASL